MTSPCEYGCDGKGWRYSDGTRRDSACKCLWLGMAGIPKALQGKRFDNFDASRINGQDERVRRWAESYRDGCHSLMLYGFGKGTGKTHLMTAAANHVVTTFKKDFNGLDKVSFVLAPKLFAKLASDADTFNHELAKATDSTLLFIDDVGQADEGDPAWLRAKKRDAYFRLIDHRETHGLTTVCTSNLETIEQFADVLGEAAADRLLGMCGKEGLIKFVNIKSYRLRSFEL